MNTRREEGIDFFKTFACLLIVFNHTTRSYTGVLGMLSAIGSFAVPYFFIVSGYFFEADMTSRKFVDKLKHIMSLIVNFLDN